MSNCTGCHNAFGDNPNPHNEICEICIRNPKYPTMKMPATAKIEGIEISVPQDMYIARDRKSFEEKRFMQKLKEMMADILARKKKKELIEPLKNPYVPWIKPGNKPWELYWEYVHSGKGK